VQYKGDDRQTREFLLPLNHADTAIRTQAERGVARMLQGSCQVPLAVYAQLQDSRQGRQLTLEALVGEPDGSRILRSKQTSEIGKLAELVSKVADDLLRQGADQIISRT
jgi:hydroxymethylbilane synthase